MSSRSPMTALDPMTLPLQQTHLIEASAGTGKTYTITTLLLRLLLEHQLDIGQILVVTFTRAATAELRDRVRLRLRQALWLVEGGAGNDPVLASYLAERVALGQQLPDRQRLLSALQGFDEAAIFTIHSFCQRVLEELAFESRASFDVELVPSVRPLIEDAVADFVAQLLHRAPTWVVQALYKGGTKKTPVKLGSLPALARRGLPPGLRVLPHALAAPDWWRGAAETDANSTTPPGAAAAPSNDDDVDRVLRWLRLQLVGHARVAVPQRKRELNVQGYDDLLLRLQQALLGDGGELLATRVQARYRAALIDEFQDTDPVQYQVFERLYHGSSLPLLLIGDPKQAIYAFRGADVFAYLNAVRDAGDQASTLRCNYRSDHALVKAVSTLFGRLPAPFVLEDIGFEHVDAAHQSPRLVGGGAALQIKVVAQSCADLYRGQIKKEWAKHAVPALVSDDIVALMQSSTRIEGRPVEPGDVAVLCRTNAQATDMLKALRERNVPAALQTEASVLESDEAAELERVLSALVSPQDARALRSAMATTLLGVDGVELTAITSQQGDQDYVLWAQRIRRAHQHLTHHGITQAVRHLLDEVNAPARLLALQDGERRLTNVLHLCELLQTATTREHLGPAGLLAWLQRMRSDKDARSDVLGDSGQLRLESDAQAVRLVTVHKSKGLQYPIVFCPYLWEAPPFRTEDSSWPLFHDSDAHDRLTLDLGTAAFGAHLSQAKMERYAEGMRLAYVALTRACYRCVLLWGNFNQSEGSPLAALLHGADCDPAYPAIVEQIKAKLKACKTDMQLLADLEPLLQQGQGHISVESCAPALPWSRWHSGQAATTELSARSFSAQLAPGWVSSSFSQLTSTSFRAPAPGRLSPAADGIDHDVKTVPEHHAPAPAQTGTRVPLHDLRGGARFGRLVHKVLEELDFADADPPCVRAEVQRYGRRALRPDDVERVATSIGAVLDTPLPSADGAFSLRSVPVADRLVELEFTLPVADQAARDNGLLASHLADAFAQHAQHPAVVAYTTQVRELDFEPIRGFLRGFVDLVFQRAGRYYLVDYKTNNLGPLVDDYRAARLDAAMGAHHYVLQYHLYAVALHRYLAQRLADYDPAQHLGGAYYLFVRGCDPATGASRGVYFDQPPAQLIQALSDALAAPATAARQP